MGFILLYQGSFKGQNSSTLEETCSTGWCLQCKMTGHHKLWTLGHSRWEQTCRLVPLCHDHWIRAQAHLHWLDALLLMCHSWFPQDIQALCQGLVCRQIWWGSGYEASEHCSPSEVGQPLWHHAWLLQRGIIMDSAYMGDIMALIGRHEWKINMTRTAKENRTGADTEEKSHSFLQQGPKMRK